MYPVYLLLRERFSTAKIGKKEANEQVSFVKNYPFLK